MKTRRAIMTIIFIAVAFAVSAVFFMSCAKKSDRIIIRGSSTVLPIAIKASEVYTNKYGTSFSVTGTGSGDGIAALMSGLCDIAMSSRSIQREEIEVARKMNIDLDEEIIGYDMIVIIVHPTNPVKNLSIEQIRSIFSGHITSWEQVGGQPMNIVVASRDSSSGTQSVFSRRIIRPEGVARNALMLPTSGAMVYAVAGNPSAIGYVGCGYLNNTIKTVTVNGIVPTPKNGTNGLYPISRKLYVYVNKRKASQKVLTFMDFLMSEDGQKAVRDAGFLPL